MCLLARPMGSRCAAYPWWRPGRAARLPGKSASRRDHLGAHAGRRDRGQQVVVASLPGEPHDRRAASPAQGDPRRPGPIRRSASRRGRVRPVAISQPIPACIERCELRMIRRSDKNLALPRGAPPTRAGSAGRAPPAAWCAGRSAGCSAAAGRSAPGRPRPPPLVQAAGRWVPRGRRPSSSGFCGGLTASWPRRAVPYRGLILMSRRLVAAATSALIRAANCCC